MPFFTNSTGETLNLLFSVSTFYHPQIKEMLENALTFLFTESLKGFEVSKFSVVEFSEGFTSIFTGDAKESLKSEMREIKIVSIVDLAKMIADIGIHKKFSFFSLKNLQNNEILKFTIMSVRGSLEIPQVTSFYLNKHKDVDGVVAMGIIKKGQTDHNHYVTLECMRGIHEVALKYAVPFTNSVISIPSDDLMQERISVKGQNVGMEAVKACLDIISLKKKIETII
jgi:6,7-dimethyl-8-ribityllumazine synthase